MPLADPIPIDFVEERPQAHTQPVRRGSAVTVRRFQGVDDRLTFRTFGSVAERTTPHALFTRILGEGRWERFDPEIDRAQYLMVREHRGPLDRVLELGNVARPGLLLEPSNRISAE